MKLMINDIHQMIINSENTFKDLDLTHQSTTVDTNCHQTLAKEKKRLIFIHNKYLFSLHTFMADV